MMGVLASTLGDRSPLTYELEESTVTITAADGQTRRSSRAEVVIVKGHTPEAHATIDFFQLNSRYYLPEERAFRIPEVEYLSHADRRVAQRTRAWIMAERISDAIAAVQNSRDSETDVLNIFLEQARLAIAAAGFWSTWATVLGRRLDNNRELLTRLLLPRNRDWTIGPGPHNTFPGTRSDWLPAQLRA